MPTAVHTSIPQSTSYSRCVAATQVSSKSPIPFVLCDSQGFDGNRHTVHLGLTKPGEHIVQVTDEAINVIQQAGSGVFELVASWRPPLVPSSPFSSFKVQHARTAGAIVAVVCENTMFLVEIVGVAANQASVERAESADTAVPATSAAVQAKEVLRAELDGGPVSALGMRLLESDDHAEENTECE